MESEKATPFTHVCTRWVFLRLLGLIYFIAFLSLVPQVQGLIGSNGILPAAGYLRELAEYLTGAAPAANNLASACNFQCFVHAPTLYWLCPTDGFLNFLCWGGLLASLGVMMSVCTAPLLIVAWAFYLSLVGIGQDFLSFQWDSLLLEAGFLAIFWADWEFLGAPWRAKPLLEAESKVFLAGLWLFRWLLFRLMFLSGAVKLLSGDVSWRNLTALQYHYLTQPLPTPLAWVANQLPLWFQSFSVAAVFFIELAVPFLFFFPRPFRLAGAILTAFLQVVILLTGNYTFFNLLTLSLCVVLLDDKLVMKVLPASLRHRLCREAVVETKVVTAQWRTIVRTLAVALLAVFVGVASLSELSSTFANAGVLQEVTEYAEAFHVVNTYGLFAVMTTTRPEIDVEGSDDGEHWQSYTFFFKPGPLNRPPPIVEPFQPRLDWQMWFAALGSVQDNPWFVMFVDRLLQGSPQVLSLLETNPFPAHPPKYIRAQMYLYKFTDFSELRSTGRWWKRELDGTYLPPVSLEMLRR